MLRRSYRHLVKPMLHNPLGQVLEFARIKKRGTLRQKDQYGMLEWPNYT